MKKIIYGLTALLLGLTLSICAPRPIPVSTVTVDPQQEGVITAGTAGSATFKVTTTGIANGATGTVTWYTTSAGSATTSAPTGVSATVSNVSSNAATVTITATAAATADSRYFKVTINGVQSLVATLVISPPFVAVTGITITSTSTTVNVPLTLTATVAPPNATNQTITWSIIYSVPAGIASISGNTLTATGGGEVNVKATITNGTATGDFSRDFYSIKVNAAAPTFSGLGTALSPYLIAKAADFVSMRDLINSGYTAYNSATVYYKLTNNISLAGIGWIPIGVTGAGFEGHFDGNGKTIDRLTINSTSSNAGLFGTTRGTITNLGLSNVNVKGSENTGGVAGCIFNNGSIIGCYVTGVVSGTINVGGIVGRNSEGFISHCYTMCTVSGTNGPVGGIAGVVTYTAVKNCYATGAISGTGSCGGIAGRMYNNASLSFCAALNQSISRTEGSTDTDFGRVVGRVGSDVTLNTNAGWVNMPVLGAVVSGGASNDISGLNFSKYNINDAGVSWKSLCPTPTWVRANNRLPGLAAFGTGTVAMPAHLQ